MEAICRKILGKGKNIPAKPARWGLQRQFPTQRRRQARRNLIQSLNKNTQRRPMPLAKKQFAPMLTRNNNRNKYPPLPASPLSNQYPPLPPSPLSLRSTSNYSTISSLNNGLYPRLPASPVGSVSSQHTANTVNSAQAPWPNRGGRRRTRRYRH